MPDDGAMLAIDPSLAEPAARSQLYTASRLAVWGRCKRAEFYRYTLGIQTPSGPAAQFGTALHRALEAWYRQWQSGGADDRRLDAALATIDADPLDAARLRALVVAYHLRWGNEPWEVIEVEREFTFWLGDVQIGGKIDALIRDTATGRCYVVEHKSSTQDTSPGSPYWAKLALDTQLSIYLDAAAFALDIPCAGAIYDVLKRPTHELLKAKSPDSIRYTEGKGCAKCGGSAKPGAIQQGRGHLIVVMTTVEHPPCDGCAGTGWKLDKEGVPQAPRPYASERLTDETLEEYEERVAAEIAANPDSFLSRGVIVRLESELPKMRADLLETVGAMRALAAANLHPPTFSACAMGREMCGYFPACSGQADISDQHIFPRGAPHPELTNNRAA